MKADGNPQLYEFRVRGLLSDRLLLAFDGLDMTRDNGETILAGPVADQAALFGILHGIESLGIELIEVRQQRRATQPHI